MRGYDFTPAVRQSLNRALTEAGQLGHEYVGPEHMLLGMLLTLDDVAAGVLKKFRLDPSAVERELTRRLKRGDAVVDRSDLLYTSRAKKVLELSMSEARQMGHSYVGNEHLLLGLVGEGRSHAAETLVALGVTLDGARTEIQRLLGEDVVATGHEWLAELGIMTRQLADSLEDANTPRVPEDLLLMVVSSQCGARHLLELSGVDIEALRLEILGNFEGRQGVLALLKAAKGEQKFLEGCALASHHILLAYLALRPAHGFRALSERGVTHASVRALAEKIFG